MSNNQNNIAKINKTNITTQDLINHINQSGISQKAIRDNLKSDGLLIWGAPVGHDALVWNVHRIYGKIRLPLLFKDFEEIEWVLCDKNILLNRPLQNNSNNPVVILKKNS